MSTTTITVPVQAGHVDNLRNRIQNPPAAGNGLQMNGPALTLHGVNVPNRINAIDNPPAIGNGAQSIPPAFSTPRVSVHKRIAAIENPAAPGTATRFTASQLHATRNNTPLAAPPQANVPQIDVFQTDAPSNIADQHTGPLHSLLAPMNTDGMADGAGNLFEQRITDEQLALYDPIVRHQEVDSWEAPVILPAVKHGDLLMTPPNSSRLHATDNVEVNRGLEQADLRNTAVILDRAAEAETGDIHEEGDDVSDEAIARMFQAPVERQSLAPRRDHRARNQPWWKPVRATPLQAGERQELAQQTARSEVVRQSTGPRLQPTRFNRRSATPPGSDNAHLLSTPPRSSVACSAGKHEGAQKHRGPPEPPKLSVATEAAAAAAGNGDGDEDENDDDKARKIPKGSGCAGDLGTNRHRRRITGCLPKGDVGRMRRRGRNPRKVSKETGRGGSTESVAAAGDGDDDDSGKIPEGPGRGGCAGPTPVGIKDGEGAGTALIVSGCGSSEGENAEGSVTAALGFLGRIGAWFRGVWANFREKMS